MPSRHIRTHVLLLSLLALGLPATWTSTWAWAQPVSEASGFSFQLEGGISYQEIFKQPAELDNAESDYTPALKLGVRARYAFTPHVGMYVAGFYRDGGGLESGVFFPFTPNTTDPFGWHTSLGTGLSYQIGNQHRFGLALHAQVHYKFNERAYVGLRYTHRPILTPRWAQDFDLSLILGFYLD